MSTTWKPPRSWRPACRWPHLRHIRPTRRRKAAASRCRSRCGSSGSRCRRSTSPLPWQAARWPSASRATPRSPISSPCCTGRTWRTFRPPTSPSTSPTSRGAAITGWRAWWGRAASRSGSRPASSPAAWSPRSRAPTRSARSISSSHWTARAGPKRCTSPSPPASWSPAPTAWWTSPASRPGSPCRRTHLPCSRWPGCAGSPWRSMPTCTARSAARPPRGTCSSWGFTPVAPRWGGSTPICRAAPPREAPILEAGAPSPSTPCSPACASRAADPTCSRPRP